MDDYPNFKWDQEHNIATVIPAIMDWISGNEGYENSFVYETIKSHVSDEEEAKSYALRLLIHYLGDIHQPLHTAARVDDQYPKGDEGGNYFHLPSKDTAKNLHAVWDDLVYQYPGTPSLVIYR
jgi:S1/P1 Nuclease